MMKKAFSVCRGVNNSNRFLTRGLEPIVKIVREVIRLTSYITREFFRNSDLIREAFRFVSYIVRDFFRSSDLKWEQKLESEILREIKLKSHIDFKEISKDGEDYEFR